MQIQGNESSRNTLKWYSDEIQDIMPSVAIFSIPRMVYRLMMLVWSFWLVSAMIDWSKWAFASISKQGLWMSMNGQDVKLAVSAVEENFTPNTSPKDTKSTNTEQTEESTSTEEGSNDEDTPIQDPTVDTDEESVQKDTENNPQENNQSDGDE